MVFVRRLIWNPLNVAHIARHEVGLEEVEEVCHGNPVVEQGYLGRIRVIGPTLAGRMLAIILAPEEKEGAYSPVTARPASRKERRYYQEMKGGEV